MADNKIIINAELDAKFDSLKELRKEIFSLAKLMKASGTEDTVYDKVASTARKAQSEIANIAKALKNVGSGEDIERLNKKVEQLTATFRRFYAEATRAIGISDRTVTSVEARLANKGAVPAIPQRTLGSIGNVEGDEEYEKYQAGLAAYRRSADKDATAEEVAILKERQRLTKTILKANEDSWKELYSKLAAEQEAAQKEDLARNKDYHKTLVNLNNQNLKNVRAQELATTKDYYSKIHAVTKTGEEERNNIIARIRKQQTKPVPTEKIVPEAPKVKEQTIFNARGFIQQSAAKIQEASLKVRTLQKELDRLKATFHSFSAADTKRNFLQKMGIENIPKTKKGLNNLGSALKNSVTVELKAAELAANGTRTGLGRMLNTIRTSVVDLAKFQARWYGTKALIFTPLEMSAAASKEFLSWEQAMKNVSAVSRETGENLKKLEEVTLSIGKTTPISSKEAASAMLEFAQAGVDVDTIQKALPVSAKMVVATQEDTKTAVSALTTVYNVWTEDAKNMDKVGDMLAASMADSKLKVADLSTIFNYLATTSKQAGISLEQVLTLVTALSKAGVKASTIGTGLTTFLSKMINIKGKWKKELESKGINIADVLLPENDAIEVLKRLKEAGIDIVSLFGNIELRAGRTGTALLEMVDQLDEIKGKIGEKGVLEGMFDTAAGGIENRLKNLKNQLNNIVIDFGRSAKPSINVFLDLLNGLIEGTIVSFKTLSSVIKEVFISPLTLIGFFKSFFNDANEGGETLKETFNQINYEIKGTKTGLDSLAAPLQNVSEGFKNIGIILSSIIATFAGAWLLSIIKNLGIIQGLWVFIAAIIANIKLDGFVAGIQNAISSTSSLIPVWGLVTAAIGLAVGGLIIFVNNIRQAGREADALINKASTASLEERKVLHAKAVSALARYEGAGDLTEDIYKDLGFSKRPTKSQMQRLVDTTADMKEGYAYDIAGWGGKEADKSKPPLPKRSPSPSSGTGGSGGKYKSRLKEEFELEKKHYEETIKIIKEKEEEKLNIVENYHALGETTDLKYYDEKYAIQKEAIDKEIEAVEKLKAAVMTGDVAKQFAKDMAALQSAESSGKDTTTLRLQLTDRYNNEQLEAFRRELDLKNKQKKIELDYDKNIKLENRKLDKNSLDYKLALQEIEREKSYQIKKDEIDNLKSLNDYLFDHYERNGKEWVIESEKLAKQEKENRIAQLREIALAETQKLVQDRTVQNELETNRKIFEIDKKLHADIAKVESEELKNSEERHRTYAENIRAIYDEAGAGISGSFAVVKKVSRDLSKSYGDVANNVAEAVNGIVSGMHSAFTEFFSRTSEDFMDFGKLVEDILQKIADDLLQLLIIKPLMSVISGGMDTASNALMKAFMPTGRASGGYVTANTSYLVGERGMELFTPSSSGNITANNKLPGSNVNVIINNNTSAKTSVSETKDANGNLNLEVLIDEAVGKSITSQRGKTYNAIKQVLGGRSVLARR